jgi:RsiW-degrading membrane proteinase PrsW (M82 family)
LQGGDGVIFAVLVASLVPLTFLYVIHRLDVFDTNRPRLILLAFAWGCIAFGCSYAVNHPMVPIVGKPFVATRIAPVVEEIFKSLVLLHLVSRADFNHRVDGAVYGFAAGIGFSVAENMLYLSRVDVNAGVVLAVTRAFSSSILHGSTTALVGGVIGGRQLRRGHGGLAALLVGWAAAIALHMAFNRLAFEALGPLGIYVLSGLAFTGAIAVGVLITIGVRQQALWLRRSLVAELGIAPAEARLVQRLGELDELLVPVRRQFGDGTAERVEALVRAQARLIIDKDVLRRTRGRAARRALTASLAQERAALDDARRDLGMGVMASVRSLVPLRGRSMWKRLSARAPAGVARRLPRPRRKHANAGLYDRPALASAASALDATLAVHAAPRVAAGAATLHAAASVRN